MMRDEDDHYLSRMKKDWPNIRDKVTNALEEALLKAKSPSSSRILKFDLNEPPPPDTDDEEEINEAERRDNIDLNKSPREEPPDHDHNVTNNLLNPNPGERPLKRKGRGSDTVDKAKRQRLKAASEVENAKLVFEKTLSASDVNPNQSRFLIPFKKLKRNDFLTQEESSFLELDEDDKGNKPGVEAFLVNQRSNEAWSLVFKRWVMKKKKNKKKKRNSQDGSLNYVLNRGWNDIVKENNLKAKDKISLWSFRCDGVLCFTLVTYPPTIST